MSETRRPTQQSNPSSRSARTPTQSDDQSIFRKAIDTVSRHVEDFISSDDPKEVTIDQLAEMAMNYIKTGSIDGVEIEPGQIRFYTTRIIGRHEQQSILALNEAKFRSAICPFIHDMQSMYGDLPEGMQSLMKEVMKQIISKLLSMYTGIPDELIILLSVFIYHAIVLNIQAYCSGSDFVISQGPPPSQRRLLRVR